MNSPGNQSHPEELLGAYALDALEEGEALSVEAHLESCSLCRESVARLQHASALLGFGVEQREPPAYLRSQIINSLSPAEPRARGAKNGSRSRGRRIGTTTWVLPLAAAIIIGLFGASLVMNLRISGRVDRLEQVNSTVTVQLSQAISQTQQLQQKNAVLTASLDQEAAQARQMLDGIKNIQAASYLASHPDTQPLVLEPPSGVGDSQGVLLVGDGGRRALLMVSNLDQPSPLGSYQVWLVRDSIRVWAGQIQVDSTGWGTLPLNPPEPLFGFEWVNLTVEGRGGITTARERMVLRSRIPSVR